MPKRGITLDEAVHALGVSREEIINALRECAPDFHERDPHRLTKSEVACIKKKVKGEKD